MATTVRTNDGDLLDVICYHHYGHLLGTVEAVYNANPGLAAIPQPYQSGLLILLPDLPRATAEPVRLWS